MLNKAACISLGVKRSELEISPFKIQTSLSGASDSSYFMSKTSVSVQFTHNDARNSSHIEVRVVITSVESYHELVGGAVLYTMDF